ncbi:ABC transporter ATP-binding protein [Planctomycetaceae bacterium SCGC AG-212-D15]|nr:ABC transporter ATP-binding protein [Planctomycetaceae bacterium SCGC AG-212-D15]
MDSPAVVVDFQAVCKTYHDWWRPSRSVAALRGVTFPIRGGEVFGLLGPNRAGKSTLIKILLTLCQPTSGSVLRLGKPGTDRSTLARVGYMHENQAFPRYLDAVGLLTYYGALSLQPEADVARRIPGLLEQVGLADRAHEPISRFSKGMVQRLALAQALINEPDLLVLDEPAEGLDLRGRRQVHEVIRKYRDRGRTVLLVSHVTSDIEEVCDRVGILVEGRLTFLGPVSELKQRTDDQPAPTLDQALRRIYEGRT